MTSFKQFNLSKDLKQSKFHALTSYTCIYCLYQFLNGTVIEKKVSRRIIHYLNQQIRMEKLILKCLAS